MMSDFNRFRAYCCPVVSGRQWRAQYRFWVAARARRATAAKPAAVMERACVWGRLRRSRATDSFARRRDTEAGGATGSAPKSGNFSLGCSPHGPMQGLLRSGSIPAPPTAAQQAQQAEALRKMLLAMVDGSAHHYNLETRQVAGVATQRRAIDRGAAQCYRPEAREVMEVRARSPTASAYGGSSGNRISRCACLEPHQYHSIARLSR